jgi:flagellin
MALVVNTNIAAMNAQRNLETSGTQLSRALQRLSSGLRVNSAADDAAGLAIATRLGSQVRGVNQAIRNANDGIAIMQTAEGAMSEVTNIITRIKELAVQSANGSNSSSDRTSLDNEVQALISEVTRIATQTKFGSTALLDGSFSGTFQVGVETGQTVTQTVASFKASSLSGGVASQTLTETADVTSVGVATNTWNGIDSSTDLQVSTSKGAAFVRQTVASDDTASFLQGARSGIALAKVINEQTSTTGVTATVQATSFVSNNAAAAFANTINLDGSTADKTIKINGQSVIVNLNGGSVAARRQQFIDAVNAQVSGVVASATAAQANSITLTAADGRNISIQANGVTAGNGALEVFGLTTNGVSTEKVVARANVLLQASSALTTVDGNTDNAELTGEGAGTATVATTLSSLSVTSVTNANTTMFVADLILDTISSERGKLGAAQNRLQSTVANLGVVAEKVSDARSRIVDADFAAETSTLTKAQILQQAGISILSQANSRPEAVLALLRQ